MAIGLHILQVFGMYSLWPFGIILWLFGLLYSEKSGNPVGGNISMA
jgi:hypothetical protein